MLSVFDNRQDDVELVCRFILDEFGVKYTRKWLRKTLESHPDYPSLLSVKETLEQYGIESAAIRKREYSYNDFEVPFLCSIQLSEWETPSFTVVTRSEYEEIEYIDPVSRKQVLMAEADFEKIDKGIVLLIEGENRRNEPEYELNNRVQRTDRAIKQFPTVLAVLSIVLTALYITVNYPTNNMWIALVFLFTNTVGLGASILLLWHDIDAYNPFLKEVCGGQGKKANCAAVLDSEGSSFLGISWAVWGVTYFATFFVGQVLFRTQLEYVYFLSLISLFAVSYVFYSVYYQWKVVKQWCPICLVVQLILVVNMIVAITFFIYGNFVTLSWNYVTNILTLGIGFLLATHYAIPIIKRAKDSETNARNWRKLLYNPDVFNTLLSEGSPVSLPPDDLGIVIGNPNAINEIIKVCNPYCGPCSKAHPVLESILEKNENIKLRIIFTASGKDDDVMTYPVSHLLAIAENEDSKTIKEALNDWYLPDFKDYDQFAKKYPISEPLKKQREKIYAMSDWCDRMKIRATPTIFINGREMPQAYRIDELGRVL